MEEQILRYYLKVFNLIIIIIFILFSLNFIYLINKTIIVSNNSFIIEKGERVEKILNKNILNISKIDILILKIFFKINNYLFNKFIHFGDFYIENNLTIIEILNIITNPSNIRHKITIIEGWSKEDLKKELKLFFDNVNEIPYEDIIADTYFINKNKGFEYFVKNLKKIKSEYFNKYKSNKLYSIYSELEIMIIGSLIEKEGLGYIDKKKISSVIINRLNKKMKLQIDATVIFAITDGKFDLDRDLLYKDLKINNKFNTYLYKGLPPKPISYVGKNTLDIFFKDYKTDLLFYFFNNSLKRHIFSKTFNEHKKKLDDYRSSK